MQKTYILKETSPGSGVPKQWRTRPSAEHPKGQTVTRTEAVAFDLDEYFPADVPGNGRDWFEEIQPDASTPPAAARAPAPKSASTPPAKGKP